MPENAPYYQLPREEIERKLGYRLLRPDEVEHILGVAKGFLAKDRCCKARIPFIRIGKCVRYEPAAVQAFIDASRRKSTSDVAA